MAVTCAVLLSSPNALAQSDFAAPEAPRSADAYGPDLLPQEDGARRALLRTLAFDATLYGLSAYLQYEQMYRQALDRKSPDFTGFNRFAHDRDLAGPGYVAFKVPNSDTLYSTDGSTDALTGRNHYPADQAEVLHPQQLRHVRQPEQPRYADHWVERRKFPDGSAGLAGDGAPGRRRYRAATPHLWIFMRVFAQSQAEVADARRFQDAVSIAARSSDGFALRARSCARRSSAPSGRRGPAPRARLHP